MSDETDLAMRRRRALFRAGHRGMREMDILMGGFAAAELGRLDAEELAAFEALLELPDREVYAWLSGEAAPPPGQDTPLLRRLLAFHTHSAPIHG